MATVITCTAITVLVITVSLRNATTIIWMSIVTVISVISPAAAALVMILKPTGGSTKQI
jgi:hypothetical protein